jgi:hypothetical protein
MVFVWNGRPKVFDAAVLRIAGLDESPQCHDTTAAAPWTQQDSVAGCELRRANSTLKSATVPKRRLSVAGNYVQRTD